MDKPLSRPQHGFTDWSYIPTMAAAPDLMGFRDEPTATALTRVCAGAILLSSVFTHAEWGLIRTVPYRGHLAIDAAVGVFTPTAPWTFGFSQHARARDTFLTMGLFGIMAGLVPFPPRGYPPSARHGPSPRSLSFLEDGRGARDRRLLDLRDAIE